MRETPVGARDEDAACCRFRAVKPTGHILLATCGRPTPPQLIASTGSAALPTLTISRRMVNGDDSISISIPVALSWLLIWTSLLPHVSATSVSTNTQVPPLQWINLSKHVQGSAPPPLKDASIGYDSIHNAIVLFGGESQQGIPQSLTYS